MTRRAYANLKEYFEKSGDTQVAFAARFGMHQSQISRITNRLQEPDLETAIEMALYANIPLASLCSLPKSSSSVAGGDHGSV